MISDYTALYSGLDKLYSESMSGPYEDISQGGTVAALQSGQITGFWRPVIITEDSMEQIRRLWDISRDIVYMDMLDGRLSPASKWLLSRGYSSETIYTHIIDLETHKWSDVRKSYQNLINQSEECKITDNIMEYMKFHIEMSGRRTRPNQSWKIQQQMIDKGEGFVVVKGNMEGAAFFMCNEKWAYYASAKCKGNSHGIIWEGIQECKRRGIKFLEMGEQVFHGNEKMINISNFKRGFGGTTQCRLILRKSK